ncbi:hypothetical protein Cs7R123_65390 [Catellatospora sp. TT07R-123]|nr:hypothetical protein Cs7R123_65390 [Catellatospora sp. TT07R-123]
MTGRFRLRARGTVAALALLIAAPLLLTGCSEDEKPPTFVQTAPSASPSPAPEPLTLALNPAADAKNQPVSTEVGTKLTGGQVQSVTLTDAGGAKVAGKMRADGSSWVPDKPLKYGKKYAATVVAAAPDGQTVTQQTSFTTMAKPGKRGGSGLYLFADREYGVAMPVVVEFTKPIADSARAAVEKRLFVTTDPPQPGIWHWTGPQQIMYRAPEYWQPGTKIKVRVAFEGVPLGGGRYGDQDRYGEGNISKDKVELFVDNADKQMRVMKNGTLIKTLPVSLGKASTPSSSGTMVIMDKLVKTIFDTTGQPGVDPLPGRDRVCPAPDLERRVHPRRALVGAQPGQAQRVARLRERVDGQREVPVQPDPHRRPGHRQGHRAPAQVRQRVHRLGPDLGRVRQGQRAAGARRPRRAGRRGGVAGAVRLGQPGPVGLAHGVAPVFARGCGLTVVRPYPLVLFAGRLRRRGGARR